MYILAWGTSSVLHLLATLAGEHARHVTFVVDSQSRLRMMWMERILVNTILYRLVI